MKFLHSLNTRLVISHLVVSLISITLMAAFAGQSMTQAAIAEAEHNLQGLAVAVGNALEQPLQEVLDGTREPLYLHDLLATMFADTPVTSFTVYQWDGTPLVSSNETLPPKADLENSPDVLEAKESGLGRGVSIRGN